jgi:hypothetical protein
VETARCVPTRPGRKFLALAQDNVVPAQLGEVVQNAAPDHTAADYNYLSMSLHGAVRIAAVL